MRHSYHTIHLHHSVNSTFLSSHLALFCLSLVTLSYKAIAYRNDDCSGSENTEAVTRKPPYSHTGFNTAVSAIYVGWADGGDGSFRNGACLGFCRGVHSYGSVLSWGPACVKVPSVCIILCGI
ncbi:hypothetical protein Pdw03_4339 [Penicillium digitatum]|uniref:Uncharacterized protein n=1 Tax=Penicillium digitatum TaxID=36651 RepID=A0A7T6XHX4_PENDI|nr:hypothetical protein Pdw03_4339 [Penicillium digitatum]